MAQKNYKKDEAIRVLYRAIPGSTSATLNVYDETDTQDAVQSGAMTQLGATDRWIKTFTPDANGNWSVHITDSKGGSVIKDYSVGDYNVDSVGATAASIESKVDALNDVSTSEVNTEVDSALADYDAPTKAELDTTESNIRGTDADDLKSISDQIDGISPSSAPMIG